ncbi:glycosyltransferase family 4 protein [Halobacteriovorax sp. RT-2-4]|uniref:glycosyltransferase family 4 protein n=1 Tax=unclassified Halobacteriovorax TaxID=2639665 RepID=UPI00399B6244
MNDVIIDLERLKDFHSGLGQFSHHLYKNISSMTKASYLIDRSSADLFSKDDTLFYTNPLQKLGLFLPKAKVWHSTHQDSSYFPYSKKQKTILTVHDLNYIHQRAHRKNKVESYMKYIEKKLKYTDILTFISESTKKDFEKYFDISNIENHIIYNGLTLDLSSEPKKPDFNFEGDFLFTISKLLPKKNIHAIYPLIEANPDLKLIIAGDNSTGYASELVERAKELGISDRVFLIGKVSEGEKSWLYENCKAFFMTSLLEGFGLPVLEAQYFNKPVFISNKTSLPEIGGDAAIAFESFDADSMQNLYKSTMETFDASTWEAKCRENLNRFSWELSAQKYIELYK